MVTADIRSRLYQASSSLAAPWSERPWKQLTILPNQTVLESADLSFPSITSETRFLVQWLAENNRVLGTTEVLVYPTNLLKELKPLIRDEPLGAFDPQNVLKPLLTNVGVEFLDLQDVEPTTFVGNLAIFGPFPTNSPSLQHLLTEAKSLACKGVAVIWFQAAPDRTDELRPSFFIAHEGKGSILIAQEYLVSDLANNPKSQLNLVRLARFAVCPGHDRVTDFALNP